MCNKLPTSIGSAKNQDNIYRIISLKGFIYSLIHVFYVNNVNLTFRFPVLLHQIFIYYNYNNLWYVFNLFFHNTFPVQNRGYGGYFIQCTLHTMRWENCWNIYVRKTSILLFRLLIVKILLRLIIGIIILLILFYLTHLKGEKCLLLAQEFDTFPQQNFPLHIML